MGERTAKRLVRNASRLTGALFSIGYVVFLTGCWNFHALDLDEDYDQDWPPGLPHWGTESDSDPNSDGTGANPDIDCDCDSDSDADTDGDTFPGIDVDMGGNSWSDWDTAAHGHGNVAPICWAASFGGGEAIEIAGAVLLDDGSIALAGGYRGTALFGRGEPHETALEATPGDGLVDGFLARLDADGALIWAHKVGAVRYGGSPITAIDVLADGDIVVTGGFSGGAALGGDGAQQTVLVASGLEDALFARYSPEGELVWARRGGGDAVARGLAAVGLADGSMIIAGHYVGALLLGEGEDNATELPFHSYVQLFVARLSSHGLLEWAVTGDGAQVAPRIATGHSGRFGLTSWDADELFLTALDSDGTTSWQLDAEGGNPRAVPTALADGSFAITGRFDEWLELPSGEGSIELTTPCLVDDGCAPALFTARVDADGDTVWAHAAIAGPGDSAAGVGVNELPDGEILVAGTIAGAVVFALGESEEAWLVSSGSAEPFTAIYGADGALQQSLRLGATWDDADAATLLGLDDGTFLVGGTFTGAAELVGADDEPIELEAMGQRDGYLVHVCPCAAVLSTANINPAILRRCTRPRPTGAGSS
jgi:hypothetical protein